jgi:hypothetical protein
MGKTIAIGLMAAAFYAAPLRAEMAAPVSSAITKPNNDASLRPPHTRVTAPRRIAPTTDSVPTDQPHR